MNKKIIESFDKDNMFSVIRDLYKHIEDSFNIIESTQINKNNMYNNIIVCGMGGSAIGGDFVKTILLNKLDIPIHINRNYSMPHWVNENTLVIICSYSGNTEETISCFNKTVKLNLKPVVISSGGYILNEAIENKYEYVQLPKGIQPRAAFGYSASLLLLLLNKMGIVHNQFREDLLDSITAIKEMSLLYCEVNDNNEALNFSSSIFNKFPIIYGTPLTNVVSLRFRCQLAENTKILSSHFMIPEQNHNEIEGFLKADNNNNVIIWIHDIDDEYQNINRIKITSKLVNKVKKQYFFNESGESLTVRLFKLIYFFDWVSFYGAIYNNIDPTPVNTILKLKSLMSK